MRRREFISGAGAAAALLARVAQSEETHQLKSLVILNTVTAGAGNASFKKDLGGLGWEEGHNVTITTRDVGSDAEQLRSAVSEIVRGKPDAILTIGSNAVTTLVHQTQSIPVVFVQVVDPVAQGLVTSAAHPGRNVTGFSSFESAMGTKWLELLKQIAPHISTVALMLNTTNPNTNLFLRSARAGAGRLGLTVSRVDIAATDKLDGVASELAHEPNLALCWAPDNLIINQYDRIIALAAQYRLPSIYPYRLFPDHGGLLSYGIDDQAPWHDAAIYIDRILRGTSPSDLPIQAPSRFELVINLKTAKALGITVPQSLLVQADQVIE